MPLSIATNMASMTAQRSFFSSNAALETAFERLSRVSVLTRLSTMQQVWQLGRT